MRNSEGHIVWKPILSTGRKENRAQGIYSPRELRELIVYERARADRTGDKLSVVLCEMNGQSGSRQFVAEAIHLLSRFIRHTDHLGWYDRKCLGVVLPLTSQSGARTFVESLREMPDNGHRNVARDLEFSIHSYSEKWLDSQEEEESALAGSDAARTDAGLYFILPVPRWKRALDVVGATAGLIVLSPLLALLGLYIKIVSPGPVFFRQKRIGLAHREFTFIKFRTMHCNNSEEIHSNHAKDFIQLDKPMTKLDDVDPRIIRGGRILRKLAMDELPQLWNILRGDMSLVGPRPCVPYEADEYLQWHTDRFSILPGLTGLWQVSGKNRLSFHQMIRLDIEYARRMSFWFDLWLILRTIPTMIGLAIEGSTRRMALRRAQGLVQEQEHEESPDLA